MKSLHHASICLLLALVLFVLHSKLRPTNVNSSSSVVERLTSEHSSAFAFCTFSSCFNVTRCLREFEGQPLNQLSVYLYPIVGYQTIEHRQLVAALQHSRYIVHDPGKACLFIPGADFLNGFDSEVMHSLNSLHKLTWWFRGTNHLIFNFIPGRFLNHFDAAIFASGGHTIDSYRQTFDVSVPVFNPLVPTTSAPTVDKSYFLTVLPPAVDPARLDLLLSASRGQHSSDQLSILVLERAVNDYARRNATLSFSEFSKRRHLVVPYVASLRRSVFCLLTRLNAYHSLTLFDVLASNCIPVITDVNAILPFSEALDWSKFAIRWSNQQLDLIPSVLTSFGTEKIMQYRKQVHYVFQRYFANVDKIVTTTLDIINDRLFPQYARSYRQWNIPGSDRNLFKEASPFSLDTLQSPVELGFTALVRARDNFALLRELLVLLHDVPLLRGILVVWMHPHEPPPHISLWPRLGIPVSIIRDNTSHNVFFPHSSIVTEAVLYLDEYTRMDTRTILSAFKLWSQNPDRLIGIGPVQEIRFTTYKLNHSFETSVHAFSATFFHKLYLDSYTSLVSRHTLDVTTQAPTCYQTIMNWLIVQLADKPILVLEPERLPSPCVARQSERAAVCAYRLSPDGIGVGGLVLEGKPSRLVRWHVVDSR